jgi:hypothetical protein
MFDLIDHAPNFFVICIFSSLLDDLSVENLKFFISLSGFINFLDTFIEVGGILGIGSRLRDNLDRINIFLFFF